MVADGILDVASVDAFGTVDFDSSVSVLAGIGDGTFEAALQLEVAAGAFGLVAADLNDDQLPELISADLDNDTVSILRNAGTPPMFTPTATATPVPSCAATPEVCRTPAAGGKAVLVLRDKPDDSKDELLWKWLEGAATVAAEFGDPVNSDAYRLCVYDGSGRVARALVPAAGSCGGGPCWQTTRRGFTYRDVDANADGVRDLILKAGSDRDAKIIVRGKGVDLDMPDLEALTSPLTVQLKRAGGSVCWGTTYTFPPAIRNGAAIFKDRAD